MLDYDFQILQPSEFECFSRDLLQARENIFIESFADGRDKGIDLRFARSLDKTCIVQCKRYKEWKALKVKLNEEVKKVKRLSPARYILTTSVDLTVNQKEEVLAMFSPYILNGSDILGKKDLNNLLEQNPNVEQNYHKLWLASTNVLNTIINRATLNWSSFELEKIEKDVRLYVENDSLTKALGILKKNHYVVISGIPGIGKTTLARMLVYTMLAKEYEEFVYVDDIDTSAKMFDKEKRQIFFFDDFLGSNSFVPQSASFENKLILFIEKIKNSKHSLFILSTREYVLSDAKAHYEKLSMNNIDIAKCTIELEYYTKSIRARILYNHLAEASIPTEYINMFLDKHVYRDVISHQNFNPRVIESIVKGQIWETIEPDDFIKKVKEFFDNPISVWQFAFDNLNVETRYALLVLGTMGKCVRLEDYQEGFRQFCTLTNHEVGLRYDEVAWRQSLKILTNCFLKIENCEGNKLVTMYNPSIADFIVFYLSRNATTAIQIIRGAYYIEQLYNVFNDDRVRAEKKNLVYVDETFFPMVESSFKRIWNERRSCQLKYSCIYDAERDGFVETRILHEFKINYSIFCKQYKGFAEKLYNVEELTWQTVKLQYRIGLMNLLDWNFISKGAARYISTILENDILDTDEWIELVETMKGLNVEDEVLTASFYHKLDDDLMSEIGRFSDQGECDKEYEKVEMLKDLLPNWKCDDVYSEINEAEQRIKEEEDEGDDYDDDYDPFPLRKEKEDAQIDEMFSSLRWN